MPKHPPFAIPPGEKYCFICERSLPVASFGRRKGKPVSPCRPCARTSHERTAPIRAMLAEMMERQEARRLAPPPPPREEPLFKPMDGFARWLMRREEEAKRSKRTTRKPTTGATQP